MWCLFEIKIYLNFHFICFVCVAGLRLQCETLTRVVCIRHWYICASAFVPLHWAGSPFHSQLGDSDRVYLARLIDEVEPDKSERSYSHCTSVLWRNKPKDARSFVWDFKPSDFFRLLVVVSETALRLTAVQGVTRTTAQTKQSTIDEKELTIKIMIYPMTNI